MWIAIPVLLLIQIQKVDAIILLLFASCEFRLNIAIILNYPYVPHIELIGIAVCSIIT